MFEIPILPRIAIFSIDKIDKNFRTTETFEGIASELEIHFFNCSIDPKLLSKFDLIIIVGNPLLWKPISISNLNIVLVDKISSLDADLIYNEYLIRILEDKNPKVSVFTPTYNSFDKIDRAYHSLLEQSFTDWEWIIVDDSSDKSNVEYIKRLVNNDKRVKVFNYVNRSGFIGQTKRFAASLCNGEYLLELDHDDILHHLALEKIVNAFAKYEDAGFCYSSSAEFFDDGGNVDYGDYFATGYGQHYDLWYKGRHYRPSRVPINFSTIRHIVGTPNHFRCWKRSIYNSIGRHNDKLNCVDDYELLVRTFLTTKFIHIKDCLYFQTTNIESATNSRRREIQRKVDRICNYYERQILKRIEDLGGYNFHLDNKPAQHYALNYEY